MFDVAGWRASCEAASNTIRENIKTFRELLNHLSEVGGRRSGDGRMREWEDEGVRSCSTT